MGATKRDTALVSGCTTSAAGRDSALETAPELIVVSESVRERLVKTEIRTRTLTKPTQIIRAWTETPMGQASHPRLGCAED